jgi:dipeptidyl aminopeptidase/acylaminoacyl peptidase
VRIGRITFLVLVAAWSVTAHTADKRPIKETDLLAFKWIADPQISPDGTRVAFVRVVVNEEKDRYETALYMVRADGKSEPQPFSAGPFDSAPRWSPDGKTIAFVRSVVKDDHPDAPQVWLISTSGGEAKALTHLAKGASAPVWSPDGSRIAVTSSTLPEDTVQAGPTGSVPKKSDVRVITRAIYRFNGAGYVDPDRHEHIFVVGANPPSGSVAKARAITNGTFDEENPQWSHDGKQIYFTSTRVLEPYYAPEDADLYAVPVEGGNLTTVASIDGTIGDYAVSPDGKEIAFTGTLNAHPVRSYDESDLFVTAVLPGAAPRNLTADYDFDVNAGVSSDQHAPRAGNTGGIVWSRDGKSVLLTSTVHGDGNLVRVRVADGRVDPFTSGDHEVMSYNASDDGKTVALTVSSPTNIGDLYVADGNKSANTSLRQITHLNEELFTTLDLGTQEEVWYDSFDGRKIQGWILKPPAFDPSKKYPMILEIHGGPHTPYGNTFTHEFLWMAAKGYVVLYTNPRGSTSYGQEFGNLIQFHYPGDDYKDLMAGVDVMIAKGYIDEKRLGVTGGSGGGILTNWIITQTPRFAAAVSQRSIADWYGFWFTTDFWLSQPQWFRAAPWEDPADFAARSPITHIANVTTPLMLVEGDADMRTPPADGGEIMFRALKYMKKPVVMVRFPGETHELSRSGAPRHRVERLQHIVGWFDQYLQGARTDAYVVK